MLLTTWCEDWTEEDVQWTDPELSTAGSSERPAIHPTAGTLLSSSMGALLMILSSTDKIIQVWGR